MEAHIFEKRGKHSGVEKILAFFSRIFDGDKPHGTLCKGPKGILVIALEAMRSSL